MQLSRQEGAMLSLNSEVRFCPDQAIIKVKSKQKNSFTIGLDIHTGKFCFKQ